MLKGRASVQSLAPHEGRLYTDEPLRYMEGGSGGHEIWHAVYAYEPMRDWMFSQSLPEPGSGVIIMTAAIPWLRRTRKRISPTFFRADKE